MDYLAFGLLAGSLIVIASFVVRDGLPHLAAIGGGSRLGRLSRAGSPLAWGRWCADAGLVLAGAGTCVLLVTVATLLAGLSDGSGNLVVGLSVAAAVIGSVLGVARLAQRLRVETDAELSGDVQPAAPMVQTEPALVVARRAPRSVERPTEHIAPVAAAVADDVWDDELPTWSPSPERDDRWSAAQPAVEPAPSHPVNEAAPAPVERPELVEPVRNALTPDRATPPRARVSFRRRGGDADAPDTEPRHEPALRVPASNPEPTRSAEQRPPASGGIFSSPLLADIGLTPLDRDGEDGFRSPLLLDLDGEAGDVDAAAGGSDLLIDETPAPVQPAGRPRDEAEDW